MKLYRFSPIQSHEKLVESVEHVASECTWMYFNAVGEIPIITSLTIFAHYEKEYEYLKNILVELGEPYNENNGPRIKLKNRLRIVAGYLTVNGHKQDVIQNIEYLRIRQPDPYRMQVGCCDYHVEDYWRFKDLDASSRQRVILRGSYEMLEFSEPDRDVLGYVVSN